MDRCTRGSHFRSCSNCFFLPILDFFFFIVNIWSYGLFWPCHLGIVYSVSHRAGLFFPDVLLENKTICEIKVAKYNFVMKLLSLVLGDTVRTLLKRCCTFFKKKCLFQFCGRLRKICYFLLEKSLLEFLLIETRKINRNFTL